MHLPATALLSCLLASTPLLASELSPAQMLAAEQVFVGTADCDQKESIQVHAVAGQPGHFELLHKKARYRLVPQETNTGAVRLEDAAVGMVWNQIPAKSMLLNARIGQRVADGCLHAEQRPPEILDRMDAHAQRVQAQFGLGSIPQ